MAKKRILFLINGYGLGNSTRCLALIQELAGDFAIDAFVYGNSEEYFKGAPEIDSLFPARPLEYGLKNGRIDFAENLKKLLQNGRSIWESRRRLKTILRDREYRLIVSDSNYAAVFLKGRPKLVSINNADVIVRKAAEMKKKGFWGQFFVESADYIYQRLAPDLVISPFFEPAADKGKFRHVPLIARKEFHQPRPPEKPAGARKKEGRLRALVMTGGAEALSAGVSIVWDRAACDLLILGEQIKVFGKAAGQVKRAAKTFNVSRLMAQCGILVINGGFSSISEALSMAKPMVVIPIEGHLEQRINSSWVQDSGMGVLSSWENLEDSINHIAENYGAFQGRLLAYNRLDGARRAAQILRELV